MCIRDRDGCVQLSVDETAMAAVEVVDRHLEVFGVPIKMFSCRIYVLVSANLPSDVGLVSLVKFQCCISKISVFISLVHFCRSGTFDG